VRAERDEPVALHAPAAPEDLLDRRLEIVEADLREHAAEPLERLHMQLQERLLGLDQRRLAERRARERGAHHEHVHRRRDPGELHLGLAPVDLRFPARRVNLPHEHVPERPTQLPLARPHVVPDRRLRDLGAVFIDQPRPDPLRRVALLARRGAISLKPPVDDRQIRTELRRRPPHRRSLGRRNCRRQRLSHRATMDPMALGQRPDREPLPVTIAPDLLELLHSGCQLLRAPDQRSR
jgi:hypothetical protein